MLTECVCLFSFWSWASLCPSRWASSPRITRNCKLRTTGKGLGSTCRQQRHIFPNLSSKFFRVDEKIDFLRRTRASPSVVDTEESHHKLCNEFYLKIDRRPWNFSDKISWSFLFLPLHPPPPPHTHTHRTQRLGLGALVWQPQPTASCWWKLPFLLLFLLQLLTWVSRFEQGQIYKKTILMEWKAIVRQGSNAMKQVCHHRPLMDSNCQKRVSSCE